MKKIIILMLLAGLMTACGGSDDSPAAAPTAGAWNGADVEAGADLAAETEADLAIEAEVSAGEPATRCTEVDPHPLGVSIAEKFDVSYERVMTWFCSGHTFDEILIALQTSGMSDRAVEELLAMRQTRSWDQIWVELGVVGP